MILSRDFAATLVRNQFYVTWFVDQADFSSFIPKGAYGFCPIQICACTEQKYYNIDLPDVIDGLSGTVEDGYKDWGLCSFACERGYCPEPCASTNTTSSGGSGTPVSIAPSIWSTTSTLPTVSCIPPCVFVLPPYTLATPTTLTFPPITTTWTEKCNERSSTSTVVTLTFDPITTDQIPVFNINITASGVNDVTYDITPSILPSTSTTINLACPLTSQLTDSSGSTTASSTSTSTTGIVIYVTSTPVSTNTYPTITGSKTPTKVVMSSTTPAGPTATTDNGGWECEIFCGSCGILGCSGICPLCGVGTCIGSGCGIDGGGGTSASSTGCLGPGCSTGDDDDCAEPTTATVCTAIVSSTAVVTTPTTSWSTTTRTHCETEIACDATGATTTTTITTSAAADPTADTTGWTEAWDSNDYDDEQAVFDSIAAAYTSYEAIFDGTTSAGPTSTTSASTTTTTSAAGPCISLFLQFDDNSNADEDNGWDSTVTVKGDVICGIVTTSSEAKQWTDPSCVSPYSLTIVLDSDDYTSDATFWLDGFTGYEVEGYELWAPMTTQGEYPCDGLTGECDSYVYDKSWYC